jgi:glutamate synthase domain-containing protein 2
MTRRAGAGAGAGGGPGAGAVAGAVVAGALAGLGVHDVLQRRRTILRNFPVIGHLRYLLESVGPELRQYIVTDNDAERPFTRDQRRWVYAAATGDELSFGFGSDNDFDRANGYLIIDHAAFPEAVPPFCGPAHRVPVAKVLGAAHGRRGAFRPASIVNVSAMSFGALSAAAVRAMDMGAARAGCLHNTGEGGLSAHHRCGADLIFQIGTGYFGCRDDEGHFSLERLCATVASAPVRAIEIKLSQGAKPGLGGMLPAAKVTPEIAAIRQVSPGRDCVSPSRHHAFGDVASLCAFVETVAAATGLPVGIKSAVGDMGFWHDLVAHMAATGTGPDFVTIDGGEGGTGAAPLAFSDHVSLPFFVGFPRVYAVFAEAGLHEDVVFIGSGRLGLPERAMLAIALGCDMVNVAREAMLSVGCIQAQRCHTGRCPAGVATQSPWLQRGLDPEVKADWLARYVETLRGEIEKLALACGQLHPALVGLERFELLADPHRAVPVAGAVGYRPGWGLPSAADAAAIRALMAADAPTGG